MNNTVTVTEESVLKNSGPYKELYAEYVRIKNNNTLAGEVQYIRDVISDPSGRVVSVYNNADSNKGI